MSACYLTGNYNKYLQLDEMQYEVMIFITVQKNVWKLYKSNIDMTPQFFAAKIFMDYIYPMLISGK